MPNVALIQLEPDTIALLREEAEAGAAPEIAGRLNPEGSVDLSRFPGCDATALWATLLTGTNAGRHGIFNRWTRVGEGYRLALTPDRLLPTVWEAATDQRAALFDIPGAFPNTLAPGAMVPDLEVPDPNAGSIDRSMDAFLRRIGNDPPQLHLARFRSPDANQRTALLGLFQTMLKEGDSILIASMGEGRSEGAIEMMNRLLIRLGLAHHGGAAHRLIKGVRAGRLDRLETSSGWETWRNGDPARYFRAERFRLERSVHPQRSQAYCALAPEFVYVHPQHKNRIEEIADRLNDAVDARGGKPFFRSIGKGVEVFYGPASGAAPDLLVEWPPPEEWPQSIMPLGEKDDRSLIEIPPQRESQPRLYLLGAPFAEPPAGSSLECADIAPLLYHLLGEAIPTGLDGRFPAETIQPDWLDRQPLRFGEEIQPLAEEEGSRDRDSEKEEVLRRLKDLGYLE